MSKSNRKTSKSNRKTKKLNITAGSRSRSRSRPKLNSILTLEMFKKVLSSSSFRQSVDPKMKTELLSLIDKTIDQIEKHPDPVLFDKNIYENIRIFIKIIPGIFPSFETFLQKKNLLSENNTFSILSVLTQLEKEMIVGKKKSNQSQKKTPNASSRRKEPFRFSGGTFTLLNNISRFFRRNIPNNTQVNLDQVRQFTGTDQAIANSLNNNNNAGPGISRRSRGLSVDDARPYFGNVTEDLLQVLSQLINHENMRDYLVEYEVVEDEVGEEPGPITYPLITHLTNTELKEIILNRIDRRCYWETSFTISLLSFISIISITAFMAGNFVPGAGFAVLPLYYFIITGLAGAGVSFVTGFNVFLFTKNKENCKAEKLHDFLTANHVSSEQWNSGDVNINSWMNNPERTSKFPWIWKEIRRHYPIMDPVNNITNAQPIPIQITNTEADEAPVPVLVLPGRNTRRRRGSRNWPHMPFVLRRLGSRPGSIPRSSVLPSIGEEENELNQPIPSSNSRNP